MEEAFYNEEIEAQKKRRLKDERFERRLGCLVAIGLIGFYASCFGTPLLVGIVVVIWAIQH